MRSPSNCPAGDDSRGLSDVIGFVLVFGLIVAAVGVVTVGGFQVLEDARDSQQTTNAERGFEVLDSNVDDLVSQGVPRRTTELRIADGTVEFGEQVTVTVSTDDKETSATFLPIVYRGPDGTVLVYSNGALFRQYDERAVLFDEPGIVSGDRSLVPLVGTMEAGEASSATGRLAIRTTVAHRNITTFTNGAVTLTIDSPRAAAWARHLESEPATDTCAGPASGMGGTVTCTLDGDVYVNNVTVEVELR